MVAGIGAGLPTSEPTGSMIIDIGGGTTDIAVISLSGIVYARSLRMAGNQMDEAIMTYMRRKYNLLIGERTAEQIKIEIGSAFPVEKPLTMEIKGRNLIEGVPKTIILNDSEVRDVLSDWVSTLMNAIRMGLERIPHALSADISNRGIVLTGGGALLKHLDRRIREETGLPVSIADDPLCCVVLGTGKMLDDFKLLRKLSVQADTDSKESFRSSLKSSSILPVPRTTQHRGSSAIETGSPVSSRMRLSRSFKSAPPPVSTMPRSLMSAESSGGMRSSTTRMAFMSVDTPCLNA